MKIAFIIPSLANKGPIIVVKNLVDFFISKNIYCEVFYFSDISEVSFKCKVTKIKIYDFKDIKGFDIVHSHGIRPDIYNFFNYKSTIKVSTLHNYIREDLERSLGYSKFKSKLFEIIWNSFLTRMDGIVVLSNHAVKYYKNILFNKKIACIYNGLDDFNDNLNDITISEKNQLEKIKQKYIVLGSNALLTYRKGLHQVIEILPYFENLFFIIIGDGPEKENLINYTKKYKVENRCLFLGYKPNARQYLKYYDFFIIPSYSEGFPLSLIEAAAQKKPIIASNIGIHTEVFNDDEVSFFLPDNKDSLIKAINYALENKKQLSTQAYIKYLHNYTLTHMGSNYLKLFKNLVKNRNYKL